MAQHRFVALDGLRGVAAAAVMLRHAHVPGAAFAHGHLAVDLFFLLSGFVIARSYEEQLGSGRLSVGAYAVVRLERLYPLLFVGAVIGVALWAAGLSLIDLSTPGMVPRALASQFLLIPFLAMPFFFAFNSAHWSILFEIAANLAHALFLPHLTNRALAAIVGLSALGLVAGAMHFGTLDIGWTASSLLWGLPRVGFGFFGGVLLWRTRPYWAGQMRPLPFALLALILVGLTNLPVAATGTGARFGLLELTLVLLVFPPLVIATTEAAGGRIAVVLGTLSFPLYAIHKPMVEAMIAAGITGWLRWALVVALIAASWALGRWVDEPLNDWRRARRKARAAARQTPSLA